MSHSIRLSTSVVAACAAIAGVVGIAVARQAPSSKETACMGNLKVVSTALLMYVQDYDEILPPMQTMAGTRQRLDPYLKNRQSFTCPATSKPYKTNPALGLKALAAFVEPAKTVTFYDATPHADGTYGVARLDGHVTRELNVPVLAPKLAAKRVLRSSKRPRARR